MIPDDKWSSYEIKSENSPTDNKWVQYEVSPQEESTMESFTRQAAGAASRAFATAAGLPGDLESLLRGIVSGNQQGEGGLIGKISKEPVLPTSSSLLELRKKEKPELEPRNKREELQQEFLGDYVLAPGGAVKKAALATAGLLGKEVAKDLGAGEKGQNYTKLGIYFLGGLRKNGQNARQLASDLYQKRDAALEGANLSHDATRFTQKLTDFKTKLMRGTPGPAEKAVVSRVDDLLQKSQSGFVDIRELTAAQRQINEARSGLFELSRNERRNARQNFHELARDVQGEIQSYGKIQNPEFLKFHNAANEVHGAVQGSQVVGNMVEKIAPILNLKSPIASALSHGAVGAGVATAGGIAKAGLSAAFPTALTAGVGAGVYNAGQILYRISRSPQLRHMYADLVRDSLEGNIAGAVSHLSRLDEGLEKELEKDQ